MKQFGIPSLTRRCRSVCFAAVLILTSALHGADSRYVVQKSDTLSSIARRFGTSVTAIVKYNHLPQANIIHIGDVLRIPKPGDEKSEPALDPSVRQKLERIRVTTRRWKHIVIHHSATESGSAKAMDRYHREERHMENGLAYHFVIGNGHGMKDGEITIGHRWLEQLDGGHLASEALNHESIGICLVGNFDEDRPTAKQIEALRGLTEYLLKRCRLNAKAVATHQQINPIFTRCPGRNFPAKTFLKELAKSS